MNDRNRPTPLFPAAVAAAALLLLALPALAQPADPGAAPAVDGDLGLRAAASYRAAARYPQSSHAVAPGAPDPVRAKRVPAPHARSRDGLTLSVWSGEVSYEHPATVELHASLDAGGPGHRGRHPQAAISGEVISADGAVVGSVTYRDDGEAPDRRAGDGVYAASFQVPAAQVPDLAASFGVRVAAVTADGTTIGTTGGFLYSNPHARLTGAVRDAVRDGDLVVEVEVEVERPGRFHLAATLAEMNGTPVGWAQTAAELDPGTHWLELSFYGLMFRERGVAGPYRVTSLALSTVSGMPNALNDLAEDVHRTAAYPLARFTDRPFGEPGLLRAAERLERAAQGVPPGER